MLLWLSRFRFATAELVAERFGVSRQRMTVRLRRLSDAGFVACIASGPTTKQVFTTTLRAADTLGLPRRKAPRTDTQREHELALVALAIGFERAGGAAVLTEREIRTREATTDRRYSVTITAPGLAPVKRWPDLVLEASDGRTAIELELARKGTARMRRIAEAYVAAPSSQYREVRFLAAEPATADRLRRAAATATVDLPPTLARHRSGTVLTVEPLRRAAP